MSDYKSMVTIGNQQKELVITNGHALIMSGAVELAQIIREIRRFATGFLLDELTQIKVEIEDTRAHLVYLDKYYRTLREETIPEVARAQAYQDTEDSLSKFNFSQERLKKLKKRLNDLEDEGL